MARSVHVRLPEPVAKRVRVHAAASKTPLTIQRACRGWLEAGLRASVEYPAQTPLSGDETSFAIPVSDATHADLRVLAARLDISVSELSARIIDALCPHLTETLHEAL